MTEPDRPNADTRQISWAALAHRDLRWYLAGNVCSNIGTWLQNTAQILLAYQLTRSAVGVGLVTGAQFASALVLGPWAGMLADRFDRRRVLVATHVASAAVAAVMATLQFSHRLTLPLLMTGALAIGTAFTFTLPALSALVPTLVPEEKTRAAIALNTVSFNVGRAMAPVLGIGVVMTMGFGWAFLLNAVSFVALAGVFVVLRPRAVVREARRPRVLDGLRIALGDRKILFVLCMVALVTITTDPPLVLGPSLAREFGVPEVWSAYFLAAFGTGTLAGSLLPARKPNFLTAGCYLGVVGVMIMVLPHAPNFGLAIAFVGVAGAASLPVGSALQTLLLGLAGPHRAGRIMAVWTIAFAGSRPLATAWDTWLAAQLGTSWGVLVLAAPAVLVSVAVIYVRRSEPRRELARAWLRRGPFWPLRVPA